MIIGVSIDKWNARIIRMRPAWKQSITERVSFSVDGLREMIPDLDEHNYRDYMCHAEYRLLNYFIKECEDNVEL